MTLQTIKDEVCLEMTGCPACDLIPMVWNPKLIDEIAARYARECVKAITKEDEPWPLKDILTRLIDSSDRLLKHHSYDGQGYEEIEIAISKAKEVLNVLTPT